MMRKFVRSTKERKSSVDGRVAQSSGSGESETPRGCVVWRRTRINSAPDRLPSPHREKCTIRHHERLHSTPSWRCCAASSSVRRRPCTSILAPVPPLSRAAPLDTLRANRRKACTSIVVSRKELRSDFAERKAFTGRGSRPEVGKSREALSRVDIKSSFQEDGGPG